jgi:UrcA family protein
LVKRLNANRLALAVFATLTFSGAALAQQPEDELVISSTRSGGLAHGSSSGASEQIISLSRRVNYADLNLGTYSGSQEIEARVRSTAKSLCDKLDQMYPTLDVNTKTCVRNTVSKGMADVRAAIVAAEKRARTAAIVSRE